MTRRTIRRYAHELFPHPDEGETRDLAVEVPYLYARAIGFDTWGTGWHESLAADRPQAEREIAGSRIQHLINARRLAFLADALHEQFNPDRYPILAAMFSDYASAALPVIVEAVLAEIEQLHQPMPGSVSALHPIPLCTCLISESPCPTARACAAIREAVQA